MTMNVGRQIAELRRMTVTELRRKHIEAFGVRLDRVVEGFGHVPAAPM